MKQKFTLAKNTVFAILLFVLALCCSAAFVLFGVTANVGASANASEDVVLDENDFVIEGDVLKGITEDGMAKAHAAESYAVVVPDTVIEIQKGVFAGLNKLTSLTVPFVGAKADLTEDEINSGMGVIGYIFGESAFLGATQISQLYASAETGSIGIFATSFDATKSVTFYIPNSLNDVTVTGGVLNHGAFSGTMNIKNVTIDSVTKIPDLAFYQSGVATVNHGEGLTDIGRRAFQEASYLHYFDFGHVQNIGIYAFYMSGIAIVELPTELGADGLGAFAFYTCHDLVSVTINEGVTIPEASRGSGSVPRHAFYLCIRLSEIVDLRSTPATDDWWNIAQSDGTFAIKINEIRTAVSQEYGIADLGGYLFHKTADGKVYLTNYIGDSTELVLPAASAVGEGIESYEIAQYMLFRKSAIQSVTVPTCVTKIGASAFNASGVQKLTLGDSQSTCHMDFGENEEAFDGLSKNISEFNNYTDTEVKSLEPSVGEILIGDFMFYKDLDHDYIEVFGYKGSGGDITLPGADIVGGNYIIADWTFFYINSITSVVISEAVTSIGYCSFYGMSNLVSVTINGNNLKSIGMAAFIWCSALSTISIPNSVTHIGSSAFSQCTSLTDINLPENLQTFGTEARTDYASAGCVFQNCTNLKSVTIPAGVTDIPNSTFNQCSSLAQVNFADDCKVETIGQQAFRMTALTSFIVPASVKTIGSNALSSVSTLKQFYVEEGSALTSIGPGVISTSCESVNLANVDATKFTSISSAPSIRQATVFLPANASDTLVKTFAYGKIIVVPDKDTYDAVMGMDDASINIQGNSSSPFSTYVKGKLYWQTSVKFTVNKDGADEASVEQLKLATDNNVFVETPNVNVASGVNKVPPEASIKYTLVKDAYGRPYNWIEDENYTPPTQIGKYTVNASEWGIDTDTEVINKDDTEYNIDNVKTIVPPSDMRAEYSESGFELDDKTLEVKGYIDATGNGVEKATDVGTYTVRVVPAEGYSWLGGSTEEKTFSLEIYKKSVTLNWYFNLTTPIQNSQQVYELPYEAGLHVNLFRAVIGDLIIDSANGGITAIKADDTSGTVPTSLGVGLYSLTATDKNYNFTNPTLYVRINSIVIDFDEVIENSEFTLTVNDSQALFSANMLYIYEDADHEKVPSYVPLGGEYTLLEVINADAIARYRKAEYTFAINVPELNKNGYIISPVNDKQTAIGVQTTIFTFSANDNYEFSYSGEQHEGFVLSISSDNKTATLTKVWYVVQLDNELLMYNAEKEEDIYNLDGWTYGDNVVVTLPRLMHGDEGENWQTDDTLITFTLKKVEGNSETTVAENLVRSRLSEYLNNLLPAGEYTIRFTVKDFDRAELPTWWGDHSVVGAASYPVFNRDYSFTVAEAQIVIDVTPDADGYTSYTWEYDADKKSDFFAPFVTLVADNITLKNTTEPGGYTIKYNLVRMYDGTYVEANVTDLTDLIKVGTDATFKVYFSVSYANHATLGGEQASDRLNYFFTVTVFEYIDSAEIEVEDVTYTGGRIVPDIDPDERYKVVWTANDTYVSGGVHKVAFVLYDNEHYRWKGVSGDTVEINFNIKQAKNDKWLQDPGIIGWEYGYFDENRNLFTAVPSFLDEGKSVYFNISKNSNPAEPAYVEGLTNMTAVNGKIDASFKSKLNTLAANTGDEYYYLIVKVEVTANYEGATAVVAFRVSKSTNTWSITPNVMQWKYKDYNSEVNLILGEARINEANNPAKFKVTDADGETVVEEFKLTEGLVPDEVAAILAELEVGTYYLSAYVAEGASYSRLEADEPFEFKVSKAVNDWKIPVNVIGWSYKGYDKNTNLIMGSLISGSITFSVTKDGAAVQGLGSFTEVNDTVANLLKDLPAGTYRINAKVTVDDANYETVNDGYVELTVAPAINAWTTTPSISSWVKGEYNAEENVATAADSFGSVIDYVIFEAGNDENVIYKTENGVVVIDNLASAEIGSYTLRAIVTETANYGGLTEIFNFKIFAPEGLAWWAILLIVVGALGVAALILWVLHEKGVLQMLTGKIVIAMRTRMTVDATIAAVRANMVAENSRKTRAEAEERDRLEALKNATPEERAKMLEEKAAEAAALVAKMQNKIEDAQNKAKTIKDKNVKADSGEEVGNTAEVVETDDKEEPKGE